MLNFIPKNENGLDRTIRVLGGLGLVSLALVGPQTPWGWLGLIFIVTGALGRCPIYAALGLSTTRTT